MPIAGFSKRLVSHATGAIPGGFSGARQFWFDTLAFAIVAALLVFIAWGTAEITAPIAALEQSPISLSPHMLP